MRDAHTRKEPTAVLEPLTVDSWLEHQRAR